MAGSRSVVLYVILVLVCSSTFWTVSTKKKVQTVQLYWLDCSMPQDKICDPLSCQLKVVQRDVSLMNLKCGLVKPLENVHITMRVYLKTTSSKLFDRTEDVCLFFTQRRGTALKILEPYIRKYTNIPFKCPLMPDILHISNLTAQVSDIPRFFPEGNYKVDLIFMANNMTVLSVSGKFKFGHKYVNDKK